MCVIVIVTTIFEFWYLRFSVIFRYILIVTLPGSCDVKNSGRALTKYDLFQMQAPTQKLPWWWAGSSESKTLQPQPQIFPPPSRLCPFKQHTWQGQASTVVPWSLMTETLHSKRKPRTWGMMPDSVWEWNHLKLLCSLFCHC